MLFSMGKNPQGDFEGQRPRVGSKKSVQQGHSHFCARSVQGVREHGKMATCLREAATAEAGNAAWGGQQPPLGFFVAFQAFDTFIHLRVTMKTTKMPGALDTDQKT